MKKLTTLLFLFIAALTALAQNGRVEGFVYDSASKEPLDFVSVGLIDASGRTVSACLTDLEGHFEIKADYGSYTLKISNVGYADYSTTVDLSEAHPSQHLRRIALQESATEISEVQVIGQRSAMTLDIDKKVFNVEQSLLSEGANATEVLQNIPTVDVDTEGNVSLRNSSNVEIWINGRPSGLSDSDKADILEMLPAESIKSVELITNPSSKYNPEGSAGIINIVLKEDRTGGYMATVNAGLQYQEGSAYPGGNLGINYTYTSKKWDVNLSANARSYHRENGAFTHRTTFSEGDTTVFNKDIWSDNDRVNGFLRAGFTYHIDSLNGFSVNSFGMYGQHWNNKRMQYQSTIADTLELNANERNTHGHGEMGFYNLSADYRHYFVKDKHEISANITHRGQHNASASRYHDTNQSGGLVSELFQKQTVTNHNNSFSAQVDYLNKFSKKSRLEAGMKADLAFNRSFDQTFDSTVINGWAEDPDKTNPFNYQEQVYAAYASYGNQIRWFSFQVGLRGEYTLINANQYKNDYFQVFPTAYLSFTLPKENELQLNYTRRINRPRGRRINSFKDRSDQTNVTYGNPELMPEFANVVEFNYLKNWDRHTLTASLYYRYTENVIEQVRIVKQDTMNTTYENITYAQNAGAELVAKNKLFRDYLDLTTSVSAFYYQLGGNEEYHISKTENFSWRAKINAGIRIIDNLSAQISANYNSPRLIAQGKVSHNYSMDIGFKAFFLKRKLSLTVSVRDLLNSRFRSDDTTYGDNFYQEAGRTSNGRTYRINLSYKFGDMKGGKNKKGKDREENSETEDMDFDF